MTRREIFEATMAHKEVGYVLVDQGKQVSAIHKFAYNPIREAMGLKPVDPSKMKILDRMSQCVWSDEDLLEACHIDFRWVVPPWMQVKQVDADNYYNMFGTLFTKDEKGSYFAINKSPLRELEVEQVYEYQGFPDTTDISFMEGVEECAKNLYENTDYIVGLDGIKGGLLQTALEMRGYDQFFVDLALDPEMAHWLLDKLTDAYIEMYTPYLTKVGKYGQILYLTDDFGAQSSMLISREMWLEFIKPREERLIKHIKKLAPHIKVSFHTDGSVLPLIEDMIDMGVDILNPVQTSVEELKDTKKLNEIYGDRICFHGAMDVQNVLINSTEEEVRNEVKKRISDLGKGGGFIISTCHNVNTDIPPKNLKIMYDTIHEVGKYPLNI